MEQQGANVEVLEQEKVVAFFVPASVAAYVTEILELALNTSPGVKVSAGTLVGAQHAVGIPIPEFRQRQKEMDSSELELPDSTSSSENQKRRKSVIKHTRESGIKNQVKRENAQQERMVNQASSSAQNMEPQYYAQQLARDLAQVYGEPVPLPNGGTTAPRVMIQHPHLPYMIPVHQQFSDIGMPRNVVRFCSSGAFMADEDVEVPVVRDE